MTLSKGIQYTPDGLLGDDAGDQVEKTTVGAQSYTGGLGMEDKSVADVDHNF